MRVSDCSWCFHVRELKGKDGGSEIEKNDKAVFKNDMIHGRDGALAPSDAALVGTVRLRRPRRVQRRNVRRELRRGRDFVPPAPTRAGKSQRDVRYLRIAFAACPPAGGGASIGP